ncbi:DUF3182 family protein [Bordetella sp. 2513F-2]
MTTTPAPRPAAVAAYPRHAGASEHECASQEVLAARIARLLGVAHADYDAAAFSGLRVYYVPTRTLVGRDTAAALGIGGEDDLYGGVVPYAFVATKCVSHPLPRPDAAAPEGWARALGAALEEAECVLPGYTAFSLPDAAEAARRLLRGGPVRLKAPQANAGRGQRVVRTAEELDAALAAHAADTVQRDGLVVEADLADVSTYSVGTLRVGSLRAAYVGTQGTTHDNQGGTVYGGSVLRVARGGFDALLRGELAPAERQAIALARRYDDLIQQHYPDLLASRRNYDVAQGRDAGDAMRMGVLEQSWRAGGASVAEIAALEAFQADPRLQTVTVESAERYGVGQPRPPANALVFHGHDSAVGFISKSARVIAYGGAE